ncbi:hypothetical protein [Bosea sp. 124]|uniref:hypothetical protein n=1 Tax=Bosea sp. 124 TaxID=2135642 RepID=UPI000D34A755|nr:hypothetical protein [Bosea sp. 124]PTM41586.1 hypothetical protein C8D03_3149 [Bosea sp. 124]
MARHSTHSIEFKRQVTQDSLGGEGRTDPVAISGVNAGRQVLELEVAGMFYRPHHEALLVHDERVGLDVA